MTAKVDRSAGNRPFLAMRTFKDRAVLIVRGPLLMPHLRIFDTALRHVIDAGTPEVLVDLSECPVFDVPMVTAIIRASRRLERQGRSLSVRSAGRVIDESGLSAVTRTPLAS